MDLRHLEALNETVVSVIFKAIKDAQVSNSRLVVCRPNRRVKDVFERLKLNSILTIYDTYEEALKALQQM